MIKIIKFFSYHHIIALSCFLIASASPQIITANEILFSDNFNSQDQIWSVQRNKQWQNSNEPCMYRGLATSWEYLNGYFGIKIDGPPCVTEVTPEDLNIPINVNYSFSFDWFFKQSIHADRNVVFKWFNENNWYGLKILDNKIEIQKVIDGKSSPGFSSSYTYPFKADEWHHFDIQVQEEKIILLIDGIEVFDVSDSTPILGNSNIALQASVGSISSSFSYFDNVLVTKLDAGINVPSFKQNDPEWGSHIYDTADQWSETPTIARYGCATTSMAMILNSHGINKISDSIELNPDSLNNWLNEQEDGYVGEGLINWYAVTRLTNELNKRYGTYKLEYSKITKDALHAATQEIEAKRPVILQIDGHFLVANEVLNEGSDLGILDPYYNYSQFSEHKTELLSTRQFIPSNTDLSNIVIYHDPHLSVTITDSEGNSVSTTTTTEYIIPREGDARATAKLDETTVQKPITDTYSIAVSQDNFGPYSYEVFNYTTEGEVTIAKVSGFVGTSQENSLLKYDKNGSSSLEQVITWDLFLEDLELMSDEKKVLNAVKKGKQALTSRHFTNSIHLKKLLVTFYRKFISKNESLFSPAERKYLNSILNTLENQIAEQ